MMTPQIIQNIDLWKQSDFKSQYFRRFLENTDYVLCSVSAAEYLGLCNWTADPQDICSDQSILYGKTYSY